jgi:hypothetical protein
MHNSRSKGFTVHEGERKPKEDVMLQYIIITRDKKVEKKCTLYPLRGRADFSFRTRKDPGHFKSDSVLLFPGEEPLTTELATEIKEQIIKTHHEMVSENVLEIVLIDSRWKKARGVLGSLPQLRRVSLEGYTTGAVRRDPPPPGGLASIEALFVASLLFEQPDPTLLAHYHFRDRFLKLNELR